MIRRFTVVVAAALALGTAALPAPLEADEAAETAEGVRTTLAPEGVLTALPMLLAAAAAETPCRGCTAGVGVVSCC